MNVQSPTRSAAQTQKAIARIKKYRGNSGFTGLHEYEAQCSSCLKSTDLSYGYPNELHRDVTCQHCKEEMTVTFIRSNLSARFYSS